MRIRNLGNRSRRLPSEAAGNSCKLCNVLHRQSVAGDIKPRSGSLPNPCTSVFLITKALSREPFVFFSRTCSALRQGNPRPPRKAGFWQLLRILRPGPRPAPADSGALHLKTGLFATRLHKLRLCRTNRGCIARGVLVD